MCSSTSSSNLTENSEASKIFLGETEEIEEKYWNNDYHGARLENKQKMDPKQSKPY